MTAQPGRMARATSAGAASRGLAVGQRLVACSGPGLSLLLPTAVGPVGTAGVWLGQDTGTLRGTCLASLGPVLSWGPSASWAASVPLEGFGEISVTPFGCWPWGRTLEALGARASPPM